MLTKEFLDKHFKNHNKLELYTPENIKLVFSKEYHFHMNGVPYVLDFMDVDDFATFCERRGLMLKPKISK